MLTFSKGKVSVDISYSTLISFGIIGVGLWWILRDDTKQGGLLGFLKSKGPQAQPGAKVGRMKKPSPPPPVPRMGSIVDMEGNEDGPGFGGTSQGGHQTRRRF